MPDCIFCKIVEGTIPAHKVHEDEHFLVFLDTHPQSPGHVQVIPKKHHRWVWDLPTDSDTPGNFSEYLTLVHRIVSAQRKAFETDWILSKIVGDEVQHAHIWLFPNDQVSGDKMDFAKNAEKIRSAFQ